MRMSVPFLIFVRRFLLACMNVEHSQVDTSLLPCPVYQDSIKACAQMKEILSLSG